MKEQPWERIGDERNRGWESVCEKEKAIKAYKISLIVTDVKRLIEGRGNATLVTKAENGCLGFR